MQDICNQLERRTSVVTHMDSDLISIPLPISLNTSFGRFEKYFEDSSTADVEFIVGKFDQRIPGHSNIIANASDVFKGFFKNEWKDKKEIIISDLKADAFRSLLIYIYKDKIELQLSLLFHVLRAASRFNLKDIVDKIMSRETFNMYCTRCVWQYLSFSVQKQGYDNIVNECLNLIDSDAEFFLSMNDFTRVPVEVVSLVTSRDSLIISEYTLMNYCVKWCVKECRRRRLIDIPSNQKLVMQSFIFNIRFPVMKMSEFIKFVKYLSFSETFSISQQILSRSYSRQGNEERQYVPHYRTFICRERRCN